MIDENLINRDAEWREQLRKRFTTKQRTALPRAVMPEIDASYRVSCMDEVNQGLSIEQAVLEARRCLDCPDPGCMKECPVANNIPAFIKNVERRHFGDALKVLSLTTVLPAVCGRVCPQEKQCEMGCIYNKMKKPAVSIGNLERFVADFNREMTAAESASHGPEHPQAVAAPSFVSAIKIAVVGSGRFWSCFCR